MIIAFQHCFPCIIHIVGRALFQFSIFNDLLRRIILTHNLPLSASVYAHTKWKCFPENEKKKKNVKIFLLLLGLIFENRKMIIFVFISNQKSMPLHTFTYESTTMGQKLFANWIYAMCRDSDIDTTMCHNMIFIFVFVMHTHTHTDTEIAAIALEATTKTINDCQEYQVVGECFYHFQSIFLCYVLGVFYGLLGKN